MKTNKSRTGNAGGLLLITLCSLFLVCFFFACEQAPGPSVQQEETSGREETPSGKEETPSEEEPPPEPGSDAALKSLELSAGNLDPAFRSETTTYTASVNNAVTSITVTGVPRASGAKAAGDNGTAKSLDVGENPAISIVVTAENGVTTRTYTVTVTRLDSSFISVTSAEDLAKIGNDPAWPMAGSYKLAADIVLENWTPIGPTAGRAFTGSFDGGGKTITIKSFDADFVNANSNLGIFAYIKGSGTAKARVSNLTVHAELDYSHLPTSKSYNAGALAGTAGAHTELDTITLTGSLSFTGRVVYIGGLVGVLETAELNNSGGSADITVIGDAPPAIYSRAGGLVGLFQGGASITKCHTTGNVEISGGTNNMAGGIAGGSHYDMSTGYRGKIEDCYSTGNITASGGDYWSWAGGIAGTIVGDGDGYPENTRIVRCYATGTITARDAGWPYVGGIVGYNYYGGMVSRCYFTGTVNGINGYDYTGGIAGYNSRYEGHNSVIEDCWSSGTVNGRINGGGIVGQNQMETYLRRCYSTAVINLSGKAGETGSASSEGAGGIAGYNQSALDDAVTACVALNPSITTAGFEHVHRVVGKKTGNQYVTGSGVQTNNLAWDGMVITVGGNRVTPNEVEIDGMDGQGTTQKPDQSVYESLGWNFNSVWKMGGNGYPVLRWQQ